ncbi:M48 family metalloprotease [Streptomyces sp. DSM 44915]|uniref:M48 family metalloprotease n=1 Tax=Streptomyces chisholmiae TaxID=3075540 RepID=A0ABU2JRS4_9ACTN|nr:M48 family metalloprotease [Streptomyces sp. DSM 44915]MDT0267693.1 M48 family metalloprotease [Streptomyces sp. DSM 44915]
MHDGRHYIASRQRGADATAVTQLLMIAPYFVCSLAIVGAVAAVLLGELAGLLVTVGWVVSGGLVFHRPTERLLARRFMGLRPPSQDEFAYLAPIWTEVCRRAEVDHTAYELWLEESDELNAMAAAGHIVGVTTRSLTRLPPGQLAGVLAHELGHHVGGHSWTALLGYWYGLPARVVWRVISVLALVVLYVTAKTRCLGGVLLLLVAAVAAVAAVVAMPWIAVPILVSPYVVAASGRAGELRADQKAAELGFAPTLYEVLRLSHEEELAERRRLDPTGKSRPTQSALSTHPSLPKRLELLAPHLGPTPP